ncbi:hypothetical protein F5Y16DRAFT_406522 [Xylariaceae sp. FL0255]|nr:hypothetical protein F5Y16DRAFT_406522 [Xylariaceae sp. FL0255]
MSESFSHNTDGPVTMSSIKTAIQTISQAVGYFVMIIIITAILYGAVKVLSLRTPPKSMSARSIRALEVHETVKSFLKHLRLPLDSEVLEEDEVLQYVDVSPSCTLITANENSRYIQDQPGYDELEHLGEMENFIPIYLLLRPVSTIGSPERQFLWSWAYSEDGQAWAEATSNDILQSSNPDRLMLQIYGLIAYYCIIGFEPSSLPVYIEDDPCDISCLNKLSSWHRMEVLILLATGTELACNNMRWKSSVVHLRPFDLSNKKQVGMVNVWRYYFYARALGFSHDDAAEAEANIHG